MRVRPRVLPVTKARGRENFTERRGDHWEHQEWWIQRHALAHLCAQGESANDVWHMDNFSYGIDHLLIRIAGLKGCNSGWIWTACRDVKREWCSYEIEKKKKKKQRWRGEYWVPQGHRSCFLVAVFLLVGNWQSQQSVLKINAYLILLCLYKQLGLHKPPWTIYTQQASHASSSLSHEKLAHKHTLPQHAVISHNVLCVLKELWVKMIN